MGEIKLRGFLNEAPMADWSAMPVQASFAVHGSGANDRPPWIADCVRGCLTRAEDRISRVAQPGSGMHETKALHELLPYMNGKAS